LKFGIFTSLTGTTWPDVLELLELQAAGATTVFIPTMFRPLDELRRDMDRFISDTSLLTFMSELQV